MAKGKGKSALIYGTLAITLYVTCEVCNTGGGEAPPPVFFNQTGTQPAPGTIPPEKETPEAAGHYIGAEELHPRAVTSTSDS